MSINATLDGFSVVQYSSKIFFSICSILSNGCTLKTDSSAIWNFSDLLRFLGVFFFTFSAFFSYSINLFLILSFAFCRFSFLSILHCKSSIPFASNISVNICSNSFLHLFIPLIKLLTLLKKIFIFHRVLLGAFSIFPVLKKLEKLSASHSSDCSAVHHSLAITWDMRYVLVSGSIMSKIAWSSSCGAVLSFICSDRVNNWSRYFQYAYHSTLHLSNIFIIHSITSTLTQYFSANSFTVSLVSLLLRFTPSFHEIFFSDFLATHGTYSSSDSFWSFHSVVFCHFVLVDFFISL